MEHFDFLTNYIILHCWINWQHRIVCALLISSLLTWWINWESGWDSWLVDWPSSFLGKTPPLFFDYRQTYAQDMSLTVMGKSDAGLTSVRRAPATRRIIFNKCLSEHVVPDDWKMSNVTAIFRKGDKTDPGNYRPTPTLPQRCGRWKMCHTSFSGHFVTLTKGPNFFVWLWGSSYREEKGSFIL